MRLGSAVLLIAMVALLVSSSSLGAQQAPRSSPATAPAGDAANGKKLYNSIGCWQCHGYSGQGGDAGVRLAPTPIPFAAFKKYIRTPSAQMPPYATKAVSDVQLSDIYAFLQTIPRARDAKDIPLLNQKEN